MRLVAGCCIIESYNMFCWYVFTVTCFPIFFGKQDAVHPSVLFHFEKCLIFFHSLHIHPSEMARKPQNSPEIHPRNRCFWWHNNDVLQGLRMKRKTALHCRMLENPWRHGDQRVNQHQDQDPKIPPWQGEGSDSFVFGPLFLLHKEMFWMILTWFGFVGVDVAYHISNWIEWRVNVVFLVESWYISWFKKLSLFICGYTLYLPRNSWKFLRRQFDLWWLQVGFDAIQITLFDIVIDVSCCITLKPQLVAVSVSAQRHSLKANIQNAPRKRGFRWSISRDLCLSPMIFISSYEESMFALSRHRTSSTGESKSTEDWISSFCLNENYWPYLLHLFVAPTVIIVLCFFQRILGQDEMPLVQAHIKKRQGVSILFHWSDVHLRPGPGRMMGLDYGNSLYSYLEYSLSVFSLPKLKHQKRCFWFFWF